MNPFRELSGVNAILKISYVQARRGRHDWMLQCRGHLEDGRFVFRRFTADAQTRESAEGIALARAHGRGEAVPRLRRLAAGVPLESSRGVGLRHGVQLGQGPAPRPRVAGHPRLLRLPEPRGPEGAAHRPRRARVRAEGHREGDARTGRPGRTGSGPWWARGAPRRRHGGAGWRCGRWSWEIERYNEFDCRASRARVRESHPFSSEVPRLQIQAFCRAKYAQSAMVIRLCVSGTQNLRCLSRESFRLKCSQPGPRLRRWPSCSWARGRRPS